MRLVRYFRRADDPDYRRTVAIADALVDLDTLRLVIAWVEEDRLGGNWQRARYWRTQAQRVDDALRRRLREVA